MLLRVTYIFTKSIKEPKDKNQIQDGQCVRWRRDTQGTSTSRALFFRLGGE